MKMTNENTDKYINALNVKFFTYKTGVSTKEAILTCSRSKGSL